MSAQPKAKRVCECGQRYVHQVKYRIQHLAHVVGVPLEDRCIDRMIAYGTDREEPAGDYSYDGRTIATRAWLTTRPDRDIIHDIAHYALCPEDRRALPEFGLGTSPDGCKSVESVISGEVAWAEESRASLLGIAWEFALGLDGVATLKEHDWANGDSGSLEKFWATVADLTSRGFDLLALPVSR